MALIFIGSGNALSSAHTSRFLGPLLHWLLPHAAEATVDRLEFGIRKCGHLTEYAILAGLYWRALWPTGSGALQCYHPMSSRSAKIFAGRGHPGRSTSEANGFLDAARFRPGHTAAARMAAHRLDSGPAALRPWRWNDAGLSLVLAAAYAASDEFHQAFVPSRQGSVWDVVIDTGGALAGLLLLWALRRRRRTR